MKLTTKSLKEMVKKELSNVLSEQVYTPVEIKKISAMFDQGLATQALEFLMISAEVTGETQVFDEPDYKSYKIILHKSPKGKHVDRDNVNKLYSVMKPIADSKNMQIDKNPGGYPELAVEIYAMSDTEEDSEDIYHQGTPGFATGY